MAEKLAASAANNTITPDEFVEGFLEAQRLKRMADEANGKYRAQLKKLADKGCDMKALALVQKLRRLDNDEQAALIRKTQQMATWLSMPVGTQVDLFTQPKAQDAPGEKMSAALAESLAEEAGYDAGKNGRGQNDNPYEPGSSHFERWATGWVRGQEVIANRMGPKKKPVTATRRGRPGRRPPSRPTAVN